MVECSRSLKRLLFVATLAILATSAILFLKTVTNAVKQLFEPKLNTTHINIFHHQESSESISTTPESLLTFYNEFGAKAFPRQGKISALNGLRIDTVSVICGDDATELRQAQVHFKSLVLFSQEVDLNIVVIGDPASFKVIGPWLYELRASQNGGFSYELHFASFPEDHTGVWRNMWGLCTNQRLFLTTLLPHIHAAIYLDTDTVLFSNITEFWGEFAKMDAVQIAGMSGESEGPSYYNFDAKIPYYKPRGLQAGVMLMNLTRMRHIGFENLVHKAYGLYEDKISFADQDILNILFNAHEEFVYDLPCIFNFQQFHCLGENDRPCRYQDVWHKIKKAEDEHEHQCFCKAAEEPGGGVRLLHGTSDVFKDVEVTQPEFEQAARMFYHAFKAIEKFNISNESAPALIEHLIQDFNTRDFPCRHLVGEKMYENAKKYFDNLKN